MDADAATSHKVQLNDFANSMPDQVYSYLMQCLSWQMLFWGGDSKGLDNLFTHMHSKDSSVCQKHIVHCMKKVFFVHFSPFGFKKKC